MDVSSRELTRAELPGYLARLHQRHPDVTVQVVSLPADVVILDPAGAQPIVIAPREALYDPKRGRGPPEDRRGSAAGAQAKEAGPAHRVKLRTVVSPPRNGAPGEIRALLVDLEGDELERVPADLDMT